MQYVKRNWKFLVLLLAVVLFVAVTANAQTPPPTANFTVPVLKSALVIPVQPPADGTQMLWVKIDWPDPTSVPEFYVAVVLGHDTNTNSTYISPVEVVDYTTANNSFLYFREIPGTITSLQVLVVAATGFGQPGITNVIVPAKKPAPAKGDKV